MMGTFPADNLEGIDIDGGWTVLGKLTRKKISTGGHFSVGYKVRSKDGREAFLKALDFSAASHDPDPARALQRLTEAYNYERDLLTKCKDRKLSRVMVPISEGSVNVPGFGIFSPVHYLVFELASGDIRDVLDEFDAFDLLWCLRSLHNVAVGLKQLHGVGIAHQDLKPSNVLIVKDEGTKVSDLGRASDRSSPSPFDSLRVPGDLGYAPPELHYANTIIDGFEKRVLSDLYLLGSLFFFHFARVSGAHALRSKLQGSKLGNTSFKQDLPYFQHAFEESLTDLRIEVQKTAKDLTEHIMEMVQQLCDPDPTQRGDPRWKDSVVPKYDLQRYISRLDMLCKKVQIGLR